MIADKLRARFDRPMDIALDVAAMSSSPIPTIIGFRRIASDGSVETIAGDGTRGFADGDGQSGEVLRPGATRRVS